MESDQKPELDDFERDFVRQSERTVDNLKRLTAYIFAISFTVAGMGMVRKLIPIFTDPSAKLPEPVYWIVNIEMLLIFAVTAGLFFYQGDKFLDNHLARHPVPKPRRSYIAIRYLVLVATMIPFFLMANSLTAEVTGKVGFLWFFASYVLLFSIGLFLLLVPAIHRVLSGRTGDAGRRDIDDDHVLRTFWFFMNSAFLLLIVGCFGVAHWFFDEACPVRISPGRTPYFLLIFGVLAMLRDAIDYTYGFRFHYPVREPKQYDRWPITAMFQADSLRIYYMVAVAMIVSVGALLCGLQLTDMSRWVSACRV